MNATTNTPAAEDQRIAELTARTEATRGALGDLRDYAESLGFVAAQTARPDAVVRRMDKRLRGGVAAFLADYDS